MKPFITEKKKKSGLISDVKFHKTYVCEEEQHAKPCQKPWNPSATAQVVPGLLEALAILSDTTVGTSAVDWEDPKSYWKSEKKTTFLQVNNNGII